MCKVPKERSLCEKSLGIIHDVKNRDEGPLLGCAQKSEFQIFGSKSLGRENKSEKKYFLLHLSFRSSSPLEVYLQSLKRF